MPFIILFSNKHYCFTCKQKTPHKREFDRTVITMTSRRVRYGRKKGKYSCILPIPRYRLTYIYKDICEECGNIRTAEEFGSKIRTKDVEEYKQKYELYKIPIRPPQYYQ